MLLYHKGDSSNVPSKLEGFISNHFKRAEWPKRYVDQLLSTNSMGTKCIFGSTIKDGMSCLKDGTIGNFTYPKVVT